MSEPIMARQGLRFDESDPDALAGAVGEIVDYRGDVTITLRSTGRMIVGYVFDCADGPAGGSAPLRILPADGGAAMAIALDDIAVLEITGRDTAAGKSFETWIRKYVQKKLAGEVASIESAPLDED